VIGVEVGEENVVEIEGDSVAHHLALCAFTAIEEKRFSFAEERNRRDVPFDGWSGGGSAEESQT
jgi:hypothetical protein